MYFDNFNFQIVKSRTMSLTKGALARVMRGEDVTEIVIQVIKIHKESFIWGLLQVHRGVIHCDQRASFWRDGVNLGTYCIQKEFKEHSKITSKNHTYQ